MKPLKASNPSESTHAATPLSNGKQKSDFFSASSQRHQPFFGPSTVQPNLEIGQPDDQYEQEADRVADTVMRMPDPQVQRQPVEEEDKLQMKRQEPLMQRKRKGCEEERQIQQKRQKPAIQRKCKGCEEEDRLQRKSNSSAQPTNQASSNISSQLASRSGRGTRLPKAVRSEMSHKMGTDFSGVNVHTDSQAVQMNRQLGARAFTHGSDIYFNKGEYNPISGRGKHLLVHELTHVVQQVGKGDLSPEGPQKQLIQRYPDPETPNFWENLRQDAVNYADDLVANNDRAINQMARDLSGQENTSPSGSIAIDIIDFTLDIAQATPAIKLGFKLLQRLYDHMTAVRSGTLEFASFSRGVSNATQALQDSIPNDWTEVTESSPGVFKEIKTLMDSENESNQQAKRNEAVGLLQQADQNMPGYQTIMQKLIQAWVGGAEDQTFMERTFDLPDPEGMTSGYLRIYINIEMDPYLNYRSHSFHAISLDDIDLPAGTKEAIKTAWGENFYLDELPFPGEIHLNMGSTIVILRKNGRESTEDLEGWEAQAINVDDRFAEHTIESRKEIYFEHIRPRVEHLQSD